MIIDPNDDVAIERASVTLALSEAWNAPGSAVGAAGVVVAAVAGVPAEAALEIDSVPLISWSTRLWLLVAAIGRHYP